MEHAINDKLKKKMVNKIGWAILVAEHIHIIVQLNMRNLMNRWVYKIENFAELNVQSWNIASSVFSLSQSYSYLPKTFERPTAFTVV